MDFQVEIKGRKSPSCKAIFDIFPKERKKSSEIKQPAIEI